MAERDEIRRDEATKEKELSPAAKEADRNWRRTNWLIRIGVCVVILAILVVSFGPYCVYRYGQHQLDQEKYAEAASTFEWLYARMQFPAHSRVPSARGYRDCKTKIAECHYNLGLDLMEEGAYEQAMDEFLISINYENSETLFEECSKLINGQ